MTIISSSVPREGLVLIMCIDLSLCDVLGLQRWVQYCAGPQGGGRLERAVQEKLWAERRLS